MFRFIRITAYIFGFYGIVFIPFPFTIFSFNGILSQAIFGDVILFISKRIFDGKINEEISSDSASLYVLMFLLLLISCISSASVLLFRNKIAFYPKAKSVISKALIYYLSLQLLKYGVAKVFKAQFYLPEPNILYTDFGALDKDILFWSTIGTSRSYNLILGFGEVVASLLLLQGRTRTLGLMVSVGIMLNIVAINFSFDISVKIFSLFLLFIALLLLSPQVKSLYDFFILQKPATLKNQLATLIPIKYHALKISLRIFIVCLLVVEATYPFITAHNFNDDNAPRIFLHGAYEVVESQTSGQDSFFHRPVKRFFIHRDGYIIFQYDDESTKDFKLIVDKKLRQFILTDYNLKQSIIHYRLDAEGNPELQYQRNASSFILKSKSLNWRELPALDDQFHWTIDGI